MNDEKLTECLGSLSTEARELYLTSWVPVLDTPPTALEFYRDWVSANKPVVIRNMNSHWPAHKNWTSEYIRSKLGDEKVTVSVTPDGNADAVCGDKFVMPEERQMTFGAFLDILEHREETNGVFYVQKQNSNLTTELSALLEDVSEDIPLATEAFGHKPDAVNFWMGDGRAVTSLHKDHYENLYCVIRGCKTFTLIPPTDQSVVPYEPYQTATYKESKNGHFEMINHDQKISWIPVDPMKPDLKRYPQYAQCEPLTVEVQAGDTLYLPSLWYHHVQQTHGCIAVNYWYDMEYDIKFNYFKFVETLLQHKVNS